MKYRRELPQEVGASLDAYIDRIKNIKWFEPDANLRRSTVDGAVKAALSAFGVAASIEYRNLKTPQDWDLGDGSVPNWSDRW